MAVVVEGGVVEGVVVAVAVAAVVVSEGPVTLLFSLGSDRKSVV